MRKAWDVLYEFYKAEIAANEARAAAAKVMAARDVLRKEAEGLDLPVGDHYVTVHYSWYDRVARIRRFTNGAVEMMPIEAIAATEMKMVGEAEAEEAERKAKEEAKAEEARLAALADEMLPSLDTIRAAELAAESLQVEAMEAKWKSQDDEAARAEADAEMKQHAEAFQPSDSDGDPDDERPDYSDVRETVDAQMRTRSRIDD